MSVDTLVQGWNARDGAMVASAFTPDGMRIEFARPGARLEGRDAIAGQVEAYCTAVPDCALDVRARLDNGTTAIVEWTFSGTHTGDIPGLAATGRDVSLPGISVYHLRDGLLTEERVYWDAATLFGLMD